MDILDVGVHPRQRGDLRIVRDEERGGWAGLQLLRDGKRDGQPCMV